MTVVVRLMGILGILLGLALLGWTLHDVITIPHAQLPMKDPIVPFGFAVKRILPGGFALALIGLGIRYARAGSWDYSKAKKADPNLRELTEFEKRISYGVSHSQFYGVSFLVLGFGMLIPIAAICRKSDTHDDLNNSLMCAGIGPLPLIACGIYLLWPRPKKPDSHDPESP
jgi:hypothetical protein